MAVRSSWDSTASLGLMYCSMRRPLMRNSWGVLSVLREPKAASDALAVCVSLPHISLNSSV